MCNAPVMLVSWHSSLTTPFILKVRVIRGCPPVLSVPYWPCGSAGLMLLTGIVHITSVLKCDSDVCRLVAFQDTYTGCANIEGWVQAWWKVAQCFGLRKKKRKEKGWLEWFVKEQSPLWYTCKWHRIASLALLTFLKRCRLSTFPFTLCSPYHRFCSVVLTSSCLRLLLYAFTFPCALRRLQTFRFINHGGKKCFFFLLSFFLNV